MIPSTSSQALSPVFRGGKGFGHFAGTLPKAYDHRVVDPAGLRIAGGGPKEFSPGFNKSFLRDSS
jgi:hypothetical protein